MMNRRIVLGLAAASVAAIALPSAPAFAKDPLALTGYDPVSYFSGRAPKKGLHNSLQNIAARRISFPALKTGMRLQPIPAVSPRNMMVIALMVLPAAIRWASTRWPIRSSMESFT
jgi:hypothetical protein